MGPSAIHFKIYNVLCDLIGSSASTPASLIFFLLGIIFYLIFKNYSLQAQLILLNNPRDEVEGIIQQY